MNGDIDRMPGLINSIGNLVKAVEGATAKLDRTADKVEGVMATVHRVGQLSNDSADKIDRTIAAASKASEVHAKGLKSATFVLAFFTALLFAAVCVQTWVAWAAKACP